MTTEELIEHGLPVYMNELGDWQKTDMVNSVRSQINYKSGIWTVTPKTTSNNTNFDTWLRGILANFTHSLGPINNDGSRTLTRGNVELVFYFNPDGSVNHVDQKAPALLVQLMKAYPTAPPEVLALGCTVRYNFIQKGAFNLTSLLPDINFDGVTATNNTKVDGVHYLTHPNFPTLHSWVLDIANFDDRMTGQSSRLHFLVSSAKTDVSISRANGTKELIENIDPSFVHSWMIAETDDVDLLVNKVYDHSTNIIWVDFGKTVCSLQLMLSLDHNLKAEGSQSPIFSLK